jgi:hypothetical protein
LDNIPGTGSEIEVSDGIDPAAPKRFCRARLVP